MRILVVDELVLEPFEALTLLGAEVVYRPELTAAEMPGELASANVLVVRSTAVTAEALERATALSLIVVAGVDVGNVDLAAAAAQGIYVANCRGKNAAAVAELVFGLVLALDRRLVDATCDLRAGRWDPARYGRAPGIEGRRLGVAGLGAVGLRVVERARAFGMVVNAYSRSLTPAHAARMGLGYCASLQELASQADVLTVHLALRPETRGCIDRTVLDALPDGAMFIHTAAPELLDYPALRAACERKRLRVGLDVFADEPANASDAFSEELFRQGLVYGTPHVAGSTRRAEVAVAREAARIVRAFVAEGEVPNALNVSRTSPARFTIVLRMVDRVGVLANALNVIKRHGINIEEVTTDIFDGARAACTKLRVSGRPTEGCLKEITAFGEVLHVEVLQLPNLA